MNFLNHFSIFAIFTFSNNQREKRTEDIDEWQIVNINRDVKGRQKRMK
jgi:hypothetical protein